MRVKKIIKKEIKNRVNFHRLGRVGHKNHRGQELLRKLRKIIRLEMQADRSVGEYLNNMKMVTLNFCVHHHKIGEVEIVLINLKKKHSSISDL